jgi:hypothetical protein
VSIWCHQCSESSSLPVIIIDVRLLPASVLCPQKEMLHRLLDHVNAIEHLIGVLGADVLLSLFEESALVSRAF